MPVILVVDDALANRVFVRRVLSAAGWAVVEASDGDEAVIVARATLPDLVIMDINMPRSDGKAATRAIRADPPPLCSVPVLAYSVLAFDDDEIRQMGMDGCVAKPCSPDALVATANHWRPADETAGVHRLVNVFGEAELVQIVAHFRNELVEAIVELDACSTVSAHRIAGIAGTLGFDAVSASWLKLSNGQTEAAGQARRDARIAIAQIDRDTLLSNPI